MGRRSQKIKLPKTTFIAKGRDFRVRGRVKSSQQYTNISNKKYDVMYCNDLIPQNLPLFILNVIKGVRKANINCKVLIVGTGALRNEVLTGLLKSGIYFDYLEFIEKKYLQAFYRQSKILLFPTLPDNPEAFLKDACLSGSHVIICENPGAASDLIMQYYNGYVLPLDENAWINQVYLLLNTV